MDRLQYLYYAICAVAGYLLGNLQTAVFLSKGKFHDDVRNHGSGNAGSTNMLRVFGIRPGIFTFVGDFAKGLLAVLIGRWIGGEIGGYICGACAVIGHDFPVMFGFKGGKGVASTMGVAWIIQPVIAAIATLLGFGIIFITKMVSLGSLIGLLVLTGMIVGCNLGNIPMIVLFAFLYLLSLMRHWENIKRIFQGTESKLFQRKPPDDLDLDVK